VATDSSNGRQTRTGWSTPISKISGGALVFLAATGLTVTFGPFDRLVQYGLLAHTAVGIVCLAPLAWYAIVHWIDYRRYQVSSVVVLGYVAGIALIVCIVSGAVVTAEGVFGTRMSWAWRQAHLLSTFVVAGAALAHVVILLARVVRQVPAASRYVFVSVAVASVGVIAVLFLPLTSRDPKYVNTFPEDYKYVYGKQRPFAPSLARTSTNGAFDARTLAGSRSCGTTGCHTEIVKEWTPSAHRYASMDALFQFIQTTMAKQNGAESTRYCGGCHDPISLFSGTKNIFAKDLTSLQGYQEGVSCLACHSIRDTDLKGNAAYTMSQPTEYLWQWDTAGAPRLARDFLIRTYPDEHNKLSKRLFKTPQYCAACHKQFIDQEVNRVGWVQLQNQYDNWANSHWNKKGDPRKTIECRECHMPLVGTFDPANGDTADYNRSAHDGRHRSHRFIASNSLMPRLLKLDGADEQIRQTQEWLQGHRRIPEIEDKWANGPIVNVALDLGAARQPGVVPVRVVLTSNKVGHDYPTGPLDLIQSWLEVHVTDGGGREIFASGVRNDKNFIQPGSFLFKAEPVDQYGNVIDRHNLWEMVGVRFRRALFPGYSDTVQYDVTPPQPGRYKVTAILEYRKLDQFVVNYFLGENSGITAPVVEIARATGFIDVKPGTNGAAPAIAFTRTSN
jgi:cytochrome c554/c'-like protein